MSKLWLKHQKFMKGNAGFSLVELIIVIAIMAALVAILAPQYIKYVEKSRVASDESLMSEINSAIKVAVVDTDYNLASGDVILINSTGITVTAQSGSQIVAALAEYYGVTFTSGTPYTGEKLESDSYTTATYTVATGSNGLEVTVAIVGTGSMATAAPSA